MRHDNHARIARLERTLPTPRETEADRVRWIQNLCLLYGEGTKAERDAEAEAMISSGYSMEDLLADVERGYAEGQASG
jgi:hypothetical protein